MPPVHTLDSEWIAKLPKEPLYVQFTECRVEPTCQLQQ